jgi:hypothetical protein
LRLHLSLKQSRTFAPSRCIVTELQIKSGDAVTIREYCANRARSVRRVTIILGVIFLVSCSFYATFAKLQINSWYIAGVAGLFIFILMNVGMNRIRCPRCGESLRRAAFNELTPVLPQITACPHCRVGLDEPMSSTAGPKMRYSAAMFDRLLKWLPALITGLILGFAVVLFSHRH